MPRPASRPAKAGQRTARDGSGGERSLDSRREAALRRLMRLARLLDDRFAVPGTKWRFGLDGLLGLVPGIGDAATAALAAYIVIEARRMGVPASVLGRMVANVGIDFVLGAVPVVGDLFDVGWKANRRNMDLLLRHLDAARPPRDRAGDPVPRARQGR